MKITTFEGAKVGDNVWDSRKGWGVVNELIYSSDYPIIVDFSHDYESYTLDGYYFEDDVNPSLFWDEFVIDAPTKPNTHFVHGVEIPDLRVSPELGDKYYLADPTTSELTELHKFVMRRKEKLWVERGLTYQYSKKGKQAAILHAKAMLGIKP